MRWADAVRKVYPPGDRFSGNIIGFIDGTTSRITRPDHKDVQELFFSGYKRKHCIKNVFVFGADGTIIQAVYNAQGKWSQCQHPEIGHSRGGCFFITSLSAVLLFYILAERSADSDVAEHIYTQLKLYQASVPEENRFCIVGDTAFRTTEDMQGIVVARKKAGEYNGLPSDMAGLNAAELTMQMERDNYLTTVRQAMEGGMGSLLKHFPRLQVPLSSIHTVRERDLYIITHLFNLKTRIFSRMEMTGN